MLAKSFGLITISSHLSYDKFYIPLKLTLFYDSCLLSWFGFRIGDSSVNPEIKLLVWLDSPVNADLICPPHEDSSQWRVAGAPLTSSRNEAPEIFAPQGIDVSPSPSEGI